MPREKPLSRLFVRVAEDRDYEVAGRPKVVDRPTGVRVYGPAAWLKGADLVHADLTPDEAVLLAEELLASARVARRADARKELTRARWDREQEQRRAARSAGSANRTDEV